MILWWCLTSRFFDLEKDSTVVMVIPLEELTTIVKASNIITMTELKVFKHVNGKIVMLQILS